ncbi:SPY [Symbiodinium sp. CCMP2592]|nr:SPY [Symbiodinium sp. CCMP2592]
MQNMSATGQMYLNYGQVLPKGTTQVSALLDMAARLKASGDSRGAAEKCFEVLSLDPENFQGHLSLGTLYLAAGDYARALEHSEKAYKLDQRSTEAMNNIGAVCRQQGNYQAAADWYRAALRTNPNCETTPMNLAVCLINHGLHLKASDPKGAIRCYTEALVHCPSNANAYYNLGVSYAEMHKYDKALINYQLTVHFDPRCAEAYNNMGVIFKEQENLDKALKYYHMAIQCNPRFAQTLNNLGVAYTTSGRLTEALEYLSRAVAVAPNYAEAYNNLGWLFWDHGDLAQALRMYERCIELSPTSKNPSQNRLLALNYLPMPERTIVRVSAICRFSFSSHTGQW